MQNNAASESDDSRVVLTDSGNADFLTLVGLLDADLNERYGEMQKQYDEQNKVDVIDHVVLIYKGEVPAACGAYKRYDSDSAELKRIFVRKEFRKLGLAKLVVNRLEEWAQKNGYRFLILETGIKQFEAIRLYEKLGYEVTDNYGAYAGNSNSICMCKAL